MAGQRNPPGRAAPEYSGPSAGAYRDVRPLDRADLRESSQQGLRFSQALFRISDIAQDKLTQDAVSFAQKEAARSGVNTKKITVMRGGKPTEVDIPTIVRSEGSGAMAKAWNQAAETTYALRLDTATQQHIMTAAAENPGNPEGIQEALDGWKKGIMDAIPPDLLPKYEADLQAMAQPLITRAETEKMRQIAHDQAVDAEMAGDTLAATMVINSTLGAEGAAVSAAQFNNFVEAQQKRIGPFYSEADARADLKAVLGKAAHGALQATFEGAPDKRAAMAAFQSGQPLISLPAVGEDGEVTAGLYDKNSLIHLMGPEAVQAQVNGLASDIKMQDAEHRARVAEARAAENERLYSLQTDIQVGFDDAVAEAGVTGASSMTAADIYAAYPRERDRKTAEKLVAKLELAAQSGSVRKTLAGQTLAEDQAMIAGLAPKPGTADFAEQQALHQLAISEYQAKVKQLETDPASYVMQNNTTVREAWAAAGDNDPVKVKQAVAATQQAQIAVGVPPERVQVMPKEHAAGLASTITTADPNTVTGLVDGISAAYGPDGLGQVIGAGVPPMVKAVAFADAPEYGTWRQKAVLAMQIKESDLQDQAKARGVSSGDVDTALEGKLADFQNTIPASVAKPYLDAARQVALFNVANYGMSQEDAVDDAIAPYLDAYSYNTGGSGQYRVPKKWDGDKVSGALSGVIAGLESLDIKPDITGAGGAVDEGFAKAQTVNAIKRGAYRWVTDENETGVYLTYEEGPAVKLGDGSKVHYTFDQLLRMPGVVRPGVDRDINAPGVQQ